MRRTRVAVAGASTIGGLTLLAATAWACVSGPAVNLSTVHAKPGQEVQVTGTGFRQPDPVQVRWNALDGPLLATFAPPKSDRTIAGAITVPADARAGNYIVILTQAGSDGKLSQMPIRALLTVTPDGSAAPVVGASPAGAADNAERATSLTTTDNSVSGATLALVALGVAGVGMFVAGMAALFAGRRSRAAVPAPVRTPSH